MAHTLQDRYSKLVDAKLRKTLVTRDNFIFNTNYEGTPTSGVVKIPVRDTEVAVKTYNKATGAALATGATTYLDLSLSNDEAVNEIIDGYDAASVPDGIVAERLDSAGYSLASSIDQKSITLLETTANITIAPTKTAATDSTAYTEILAARTSLSRMGVPNEGRWLIASPEFMSVVMKDDTFIKQGDLSQELVAAGAVGKIGGFTVYESSNTMFEDEELVEGFITTTEFIAGHNLWCHRVDEWAVPVSIKDLTNVYIGASAVQGRKIYGLLISKPATVYVKRTETAVEVG